tara:strand:+ start:924 stop:2327 length:1404 start_codon:yes stop_codon:yes gene_type:complete
MATQDIELLAHLMRRAGFGATKDELDDLAKNSYESVVDNLLENIVPVTMPDDLIRRYHVDQSELRIQGAAAANWLYKMISTNSPISEKMALFWHSLFATGERKVNNMKTMVNQIDMFRENGLGNFKTLLVKLSKDPAMLYWLDNNENHKDAVNENYGRELLELFSMGIGNYTEEDVKECARAFTGWTVQAAEYMTLRSTKASIWPYGRVAFQFEYRPDDHDGSSKTFLGETGNFNGEDIIDIIVAHPATAKFVAWRLFLFFVSDDVDELGELLIEELALVYMDSGFEIRDMMKHLFMSNYFKSAHARFAKVKSPVELVAGILKITRQFNAPKREIWDASVAIEYMGQELLNPPSVEGWHEGTEWIDSGTMVERVNFGSLHMSDMTHPGIRNYVDRVKSDTESNLDPVETVDKCLSLLGPLKPSTDTRDGLLTHVVKDGPIDLHDPSGEQRIADIFGLIASTREFQKV